MGSLETISTISTVCRPTINNNHQASANAFNKMENSPFHLFSLAKLDATTNNYKRLGSRLVAYYGDYTYSYGNTKHEPRRFDENSYLLHILSYIKIVLPEFKFNSAMVHKYTDGESTIPHHSDDEQCIEKDSNIVCISLGASRCLEFKNKNSGQITKVQLDHGDVISMTKPSQNLFTHAILSGQEKEPRISVTLRFLKPLHTGTENVETAQQTGPYIAVNSSRQEGMTMDVNYNEYQVNTPTAPYAQPIPLTNGYQDLSTNVYGNRPHESQFRWQREGWQPSHINHSRPQQTRSSNSHEVQPPSTLNNQSARLKFPPASLHPSRRQPNDSNSVFKPFKQKQDAVYISSSMFADIDPLKLSSDEFNAHVFFYRGADSYQMMDKLRRDTRIQELARKSTVSKVFLLTGSNNVDNVCFNRQSTRDAYSSLSQTISYVQSLFGSAILNVINILPRVTENRKRVTENRKRVIGLLNSHIRNLVGKDKSGRLNLVDTYRYKMFNFSDGTRKADLFRKTHINDKDNVHLNNLGVVKLGKHLKYLAHC